MITKHTPVNTRVVPLRDVWDLKAGQVYITNSRPASGCMEYSVELDGVDFAYPLRCFDYAPLPTELTDTLKHKPEPVKRELVDA